MQKIQFQFFENIYSDFHIDPPIFTPTNSKCFYFSQKMSKLIFFFLLNFIHFKSQSFILNLSAKCVDYFKKFSHFYLMILNFPCTSMSIFSISLLVFLVISFSSFLYVRQTNFLLDKANYEYFFHLKGYFTHIMVLYKPGIFIPTGQPSQYRNGMLLGGQSLIFLPNYKLWKLK